MRLSFKESSCISPIVVFKRPAAHGNNNWWQQINEVKFALKSVSYKTIINVKQNAPPVGFAEWGSYFEMFSLMLWPEMLDHAQ